MSQRLLITLKKNITDKDNYYDCIYTENSTLENLLKDWCYYDRETGIYFGPFKVTIRGREIFDQFMEDFGKLKKYIPTLQSLSDCWAVFEGDKEYWNEKVSKQCWGAVEAVMDEVNKEKDDEKI